MGKLTVTEPDGVSIVVEDVDALEAVLLLTQLPKPPVRVAGK